MLSRWADASLEVGRLSHKVVHLLAGRAKGLQHHSIDVVLSHPTEMAAHHVGVLRREVKRLGAVYVIQREVACLAPRAPRVVCHVGPLVHTNTTVLLEPV